MVKVRKGRVKFRKITILIFLVILIGILYVFKDEFNFKETKRNMYVASLTNLVTIFDEEGNDIGTIPRGSLVSFYSDKKIKGKELYAIKYNKKEYYIDKNNLVKDKKDVVLTEFVYVRTSQNLLSNMNDGVLLSLVRKGEELKVVGFDEILPDGNVNAYKVDYQGTTGYIYATYTTLDKESSLLQYEASKYYDVHANRGNRFNGGDAGKLDYYPVTKPIFKDNIMPDKVYALYLNGTSKVIKNVDDYIEFAKTTKINTFVVDIKDSGVPAYKSKVMEEYSKTNYDKAQNSFEDYKAAIKKIKDAGFYVVGRITTFKDQYYVMDHKEDAIGDTRNNEPFLHNGTYWPSPYKRSVWEFNVNLAKEAVREFGFNEIQFDYVRFPDRTLSLEKEGIIDFKNIYNEEKAEAIQRFLLYAKDELHKLNVYVSADVFGESAHAYVTAYGQYFPAISNVVDVISAMPYPDHFSKYEYGFTEPVWTKPYEILNYWGSNYVAKRQSEIPTPAKVRTWIQTYDTIYEPHIVYGEKEVEDQIKGLFDAGLNDGYMTWNSGSNLNKYKSQAKAYSKEY